MSEEISVTIGILDMLERRWFVDRADSGRRLNTVVKPFVDYSAVESRPN